jgi:predicted amidohydrolase YtcJ
LPEPQRRSAIADALELALSRGAVHLHAQLMGLDSREAYADEIETLRGLGRAKWHPKICERDAALARDLGLPYVGGDVFLDGSLGSGTAALCAPYCDRPGNGRLALDDDAVHAFFAEADALGIAAGVHAIGDRATTAAGCARAISSSTSSWRARTRSSASPHSACISPCSRSSMRSGARAAACTTRDWAPNARAA